MNILLTNDDGAASPGILLLESALKERGYQTLVVAPDRDRSGFSQAVSLDRPFRAKKEREGLWLCGGTPADCVIFTLTALDFKPDLVISGINAGANLGTDLIFSATAGAARQAALCRIPSLAYSLVGNGPYLWEPVAAWGASHAEELSRLWTEGLFVNVNFPPLNNLSAAKIERCVPAIREYTDRARLGETGDDGWQDVLMVLGSVNTHAEEAGRATDAGTVRRGNIAVSLVLTQPQAACNI